MWAIPAQKKTKMFRFAVLALALVAVSNASILDVVGPIAGGIMKGTVTKEKLQEVLELANAKGEIESIDNVRTQVVAGIRYIVDYTTKDGQKCVAMWVSVPWKNPKNQNVDVSCQ